MEEEEEQEEEEEEEEQEEEEEEEEEWGEMGHKRERCRGVREITYFLSMPTSVLSYDNVGDAISFSVHCPKPSSWTRVWYLIFAFRHVSWCL